MKPASGLSRWNTLSLVVVLSLGSSLVLGPAQAAPQAGNTLLLPLVMKDTGAFTAGVYLPLRDARTWVAETNDFIAQTNKVHGVHLTASGFACPWVDEIADVRRYLDHIRSLGALPLITWMPMNCENGFGDVQDLGLSDILNGSWDAYIQKWAQDLHALGYPVMVRWGHEMNIPSYSWAGAHAFGPDGKTDYDQVAAGACGGNPLRGCYGDPNVYDGPERYVAAYRRVHGLVEAITPNVTWVWNPNAQSFPPPAAAAWNDYANYYPGDAYVDWVGPDGYNWGEQSGNGGFGFEWSSFDRIFAGILNDMAARYPAKPQIIPEFASVEDPNDPQRKAAWIRDAYQSAGAKYPLLRVVCWTEERFFDAFRIPPDYADFRAMSSPQALGAYRAAVAGWGSAPPEP